MNKKKKNGVNKKSLEERRINAKNNFDGLIGININYRSNCKLNHHPNFKVILLLIGFLAIVILQISQVSSIGITPGRNTINFEPGLSKEVSFSIVNTENKDMSVVFFVRGDLNKSITLSKAYAEFSASESSKSFSYNIRLPDKIDKPGLYETEIVALEMPKNLAEQGTFVGATVAIVTQLHVYVPYPNKYIEGQMNIITRYCPRQTCLCTHEYRLVRTTTVGWLYRGHCGHEILVKNDGQKRLEAE